MTSEMNAFGYVYKPTKSIIFILNSFLFKVTEKIVRVCLDNQLFPGGSKIKPLIQSLHLKVDGQCFPALKPAFSRQLRKCKNTVLLNSVFSVLLALMPNILTAPSFTAILPRISV